MVRASPLRKASLSLIGTIIGAGIFGLPAIFVRVGFWPGTALFVLLTLVVLATHLLYAEVCLAFRQKMRLTGYAGRELGRAGFLIASITHPLQIVGSNLIYLVLGGEFLASLALVLFRLTVDPIVFSVVLFVVTALIVLVGLRFMARVESSATWLLIASMVFAIVLLSFSTRHATPLPSHWPLFIFPFGAFLFSLSGFPVIAEIVEIAERNRHRTYLAIIIGTLVAAWLSWMFGMGVALFSNGRSTLDPGTLASILPVAWGWMIPLVGILAVLTSYVTTAQELKSTVRFDFHLRREAAWAVAVLVPFVCLFFVSRDLITMIGWVGTIFGGINGTLIAVISYRVLSRQPHVKHWLTSLAFFVAVAYGVGMILSITSRL